MRIVAGQYRGRAIVAPPGRATRPTSDRARETLFSMLHSRIGSFAELRVADLFAGSGALGLEALSRGAAHCHFVDGDAAARQAIETNLRTLSLSGCATVSGGSALALPSVREPFDMIFADPPYAEGSGSAAVDAVVRARWLARGGWMAVETATDDPLDPGPLTLARTRKVGKAMLHLLFLSV